MLNYLHISEKSSTFAVAKVKQQQIYEENSFFAYGDHAYDNRL